MNALSVRLGFLVQLFSGWANRRQLSVIEYLLEENRCCASSWKDAG
jgi:hypothetical protein